MVKISHPDDLALAQRIATGDEEAASELFQRQSGEMYGYARKMLFDISAAEDALQDAMLGMLRSIKGYNGAVSLRAWSFAILRHKIIDSMRRRGREPVVSMTDPEREDYDQTGHWNIGVNVDPWNEQAEMLDIVRKCMSLLPHNQREALHLRAIDGLPANEIAEVLDMTYSSLRQTLHRGRQSVRRCADQEMGNPSSGGAA